MRNDMPNWITVDASISQKIEIFTLAEILDLDEHLVLGKVVVLFCWARTNSVDSDTVNVTKAMVDKVVKHEGFAKALIDPRVGYLKEGRADYVVFIQEY